jgi:hypothetical protein
MHPRISTGTEATNSEEDEIHQTNRAAEEKIKIANFNILHTACLQFLHDHTDDSHAEVFEHIDHREFINWLNGILSNSTLQYDKLVAEFKTIFSLRAQFIFKTHMSLDVNSTSVINQFCYEVAKFIDEDNMMGILLPTLNLSPLDLNRLKFGRFILTEDGKNIIDVQSLLYRAFERAKVNKHPLFKKSNGHYLTSNEEKRLFTLYPEIALIKDKLHSNQPKELLETMELFNSLKRKMKQYTDSYQPRNVQPNIIYTNIKLFHEQQKQLAHESQFAKDTLKRFHHVKFDVMKASVAMRLSARQEPLKALYQAWSFFILDEIQRIELREHALKSYLYQTYLKLADKLDDIVGIQNKPLPLSVLREVDQTLENLYAIGNGDSNVTLFSSRKINPYKSFIEKNKALIAASELHDQTTTHISAQHL